MKPIKHMQNNNTTVVEVPANVWHRLASAIAMTGLVVADGFFQCRAPDGVVWTYQLFVPAIYAGDVILTPAPIVP